MTSVLTAKPCPHCGQALFIMNNPYPRPKPKPLTRYVHKRGMQGDVETHAENIEHAISIFRHYGFSNASKLNVHTGRSKMPVPASDDFERAK